jgi:hypothetical protein
MSLLGVPLQTIKIEDLQRFLDDAEAEPLLWEAKGTSLSKHDVRKEVCGFANGRESAYLILGASRDGDNWKLDGVDFGGDPPAWVSGVVADGLRPIPLVDVRSIPLGNRKHIAIVEVPPVAHAPCICRGTVYERVSGRTVPVKEPMRLAELYKRGQNARALAVTQAAAAATEVIEHAALPGRRGAWPRLALAVSAASHPPNISSRLFSESYEEALIDVVRQRLIPPIGNLPAAYGPTLRTGFAQSNRSVDCADPHSHGRPRYWHVRAIWDGTVVVYGSWDIDSVLPDHIVDELVTSAWMAASELLTKVGGSGPIHMEMRIDGGKALLGLTGEPLPQIQMGRGPIEGPPEDDDWASVKRELRRATGEQVYEVPSGAAYCANE